MQPPGITGLSLLLSYEGGKICGRIVATSWIVHVRRQREKTVLQIFRMMKFLHRLKLQMRYSTHYHRIIFSDPTISFLDPACKSGVILREAAKRFIKGLEKEIPNLQERINHIYQNQLFGIGITELTSLLSRRR